MMMMKYPDNGGHASFLLLILISTATSVVCSSANNDVVYRPEDDDRCNKTVDIYQAISSPIVTDENRNKPLHCTYRIRVRPPRNDWVVFVRFTRMRVGEPSEDRQTCNGGYVQIIDGYRDSNHSNKDSPGFYCGEIDSPKTFMSETPHVKIVLHVEKYDTDYFLQFDANVEQQQEVHARYGQYAQLYPHRRGTLVKGTYCERWYQSCAPTRCFVQSPAYPGVYPRNLKCRYHLKVSQSVVALDLNTFDVDGLRCDNLLLCFPRPITKIPEECPFDYVKVYDGDTKDSPLIITLCGRGRLKSQIVASGSDMLVEFVSSPAGPLLNTGFHFKAESVYGESEADYEALHLNNGSCTIEKNLRDTHHATFTNLRSWYPPNTTCSYKFVASENEILKLSFDYFRMERVTLCAESLRLYDSNHADPSKIMVKLCDINKPRTDQPKSVYQSTGPAIFIQFFSKVGSLEGSSLNYAFEVRAVNVESHRNSLRQNTCSKSYKPEDAMSGSFSTTFQELNSSSSTQPIVCNYTFDASGIPQGQVNVTLHTSLRTVDDCDECFHEPVIIEAYLGPGPTSCFCKISSLRRYTLYSMGPHLHMTLRVDQKWDNRLLPQKQMLNFSYNFYTEPRCGPERLELGLQGTLFFPPLPGVAGALPSTCTSETQCRERPLYCTWKIPAFHRMDVALRILGLSTNANCSMDHITINKVLLCPSATEQEVIVHKEDVISDVIVGLKMSSDIQQFNISIKWTQLRMLPTQTNRDSLVSLGKDCDFLCANSMACLTRELVCNFFPNCPGLLNGSPADEDPKLCMSEQSGLSWYWWLGGTGLASCIFFSVCLTVVACRRCNYRRHRF